MKVACFLFDPNVGGPHIRAAGVYARLMRRGFDPLIVLPDVEGTAMDFFAATDITVKRVRFVKPVSPSRLKEFIKYVLMTPISVRRIYNFLKQSQCAVVHVNGAADICPVVAARLCRVPVVWHLNDTALPKVIAKCLSPVIRLLSTEIVVAAKAVGDHYALSARDYSVLYAPVNIEMFPARQPRVMPRAGATINVGLVGNWNWIKGQDRFLEVIDRLVRQGYNIRACMIGGFPQSQSSFWGPLMERLKHSNLGSIVEVAGFVPKPIRYLEGLDVLMLTSRSEACPISVLEGMAVGVPQIAFQVGGVGEILRREGGEVCGLVVPEGDLEAMVKAFSDLLSDSDLFARMQTNAQSVAKEVFCLDRCAELHANLYQRVSAAR